MTCPRREPWEHQDLNSGKSNPKSYQLPVSSWLKIVFQVLVFGFFLLSSFPRRGPFSLFSFVIINTPPHTPSFPCPHQKYSSLSVPGHAGWWMAFLNPWPCLEIRFPFMNAQGARSLGNRHKMWNQEACVGVMAPWLMDMKLSASLHFLSGFWGEPS